MRANNNGCADNHLYMMDTLFDDNNNNILTCVNGVIGGNGSAVVGRGMKRQRNDIVDISSFKRNMTLDFSAPASNKKEKLMKTCVLESPDLKKLNIGSPELEHMIINGNGLMSATPTPGVLPQYFLKQESEATEEQEQFSRGFTEALDKLHQTSEDHHNNNGLISNHCNNSHTIQMSSHHQQQQHQQQHQQQQQQQQSNHSSNNVTLVDQQQHHNNINVSVNNSVINHGLSVVSSNNGYAHHNSSNSNNSNSVDNVYNAATIMPVTTSSSCVQFAIPSIPPHEQYVNVATSNGGEVIISGAIDSSNCNNNSSSNSSVSTCGSALPTYSAHINNSQMAPIDMGEQERIKLERKRLRNRIAASKCRRRKLERISRLEDKVKSLKGENAELSIVVNKLRDQVCSLKQQVMDHVKCGCQLMVNQQ